jgi:Ca-activated chloride channel homolog
MAGKHSATRGAHDPLPHRTQRRAGRFVVTLLAVLALAAAGTATVLALRSRSHHRPAAAPSPTCTGQISVPVTVTPSVQAAVATIANQWTASHPATDGRCVRVVVSGQDSAAATKGIASGMAPALWIPDSTVWTSKLTAAAPALATAIKVDGSIAKSPLVVATAPGNAAAIAAAAKAGWTGALSGPVLVTLIDPTTTATGAMMVLGLTAASNGVPGAAAKLVGLYIRLQAAVLPNATAGMTTLQTRPKSAPAFVASEQDVFLANRGKSAPVVSAVYPNGPTPMLDFPMVRIARRTSDPLVVSATTQFEQQLTSSVARAELADAGLRDPSGTPLRQDHATTGVSARPVTPASASITPALQATAQRLWRAAAKPSQLLAVIDVSGSMASPSGNGLSKIQVVAAAAQTAMTAIPDDWTLGLWTFSTRPPPGNDWTERIPLGHVKTQRAKLTGAAGQLPQLVGGNTGLYDTALAAFDAVSARYDPASVNVVALLTDGQNVDPGDMDLPTLLSKLKAEYQPAKPVHIVTIGFGKDADAAALKAISDATRGQTYLVNNPKDIVGVMLDSILANN